MNNHLFLLFLLSIFTHLSVQQLSVPLQYGRIGEPSKSNSTHHHLFIQNRVNNHRRFSRLSHNVQYIQKHLALEADRSKISHQLRVNPDNTHLNIQTFNLEPSVYAFSLPMKIAGIDYKMTIDSGSSDIFIKGENSLGKPKNRYHCGQTCIDNNDHYRIGYLDGKLQTYEAKLPVQIGNHKFNESILVAYKVQKNFKQNEGLIGLSFPELASNPNPSFLQTLKNQKIIDVYAFGVNLNFQDKNRSFITFGSFDSNFFEGNLSFYPLTSKLFYYIKSKGVSVGQSSLMSIATALFDTGNTCISIPRKYEQDILKQFNVGKNNKINKCFFSVQQNAKMFSVLRCKVENFDILPLLNIHLGTQSFSIEKQFYLQACDRRPKDTDSKLKDEEGAWYCDMYIESFSRQSELFLGDAFFNRYYTYFNLEKQEIGIAKNKEKISLNKIKQNQLDASVQDWLDILRRTNENQNIKDINRQIEQIKEVDSIDD